MTSFHVDENNPLPKPTRVWGLGTVIGDRQKNVLYDVDYDDWPAVMEAVRSAFEDTQTK